MKAAFLTSPKHIDLDEVAIPEPKTGEVRVRLKQVGICGSDVHLFLGHRALPQPTIIGHEGYGFIDKTGDGVTGRQIGERVIIEPNIPCRQCRYCLQGHGNICVNKRVAGLTEAGCFAEYVCWPEAFCRPVPDDITDTDAVTVEPMAVGVHALFKSSALPGDTIAVIGLGAIGLLLTHLAISLGYRVLVTELNARKRQLAVAEGAIAVEGDADTLNRLWEQYEVCTVFECAGSAATASLATAAAPRGSEVVLLGLASQPASFTPLKIAREGIHIVPSIIYDHPADFKRTLNLIQRKKINPGKIISRYMPLNQLQEALTLAALGDDTKIIVTI
ncbi:zinc-dependent alcohol dehydrogenase [Arsenicibacter rosenii]|uniref:L-iditol 2-dehydrogenase n=1 Tax=Arsenicibacter rosenii TaxID=1750698 RepID=A0A1S2VLF8_9BACT|nr:alcohol dehydrogenase catalytic domain-containing protein [Arsenicibacter rosenii]OIN59036.1 L-iditol 2-dehydrogenase [Arsenicibacter rosenii]